MKDMHQGENSNARGTYYLECREYEGGPLVWKEPINNLVTTQGGNNLLDTYFAGSSYSATWYLGLITTTGYTTGPALNDTAASHAGWAESVNYSQAARPAAAWNSAAAKSKSMSAPLAYTINASDTIAGCFLISNATKGGTSGILYSAGAFLSGNQPVVSGNSLTVSYTANI